MTRRVFKTKPFARWARREGIENSVLVQAIMEIERGMIDADLGASLIKKRLSRRGEGKRGGYRVVIAARIGGKSFFLPGFAKSRRDDLRDDELVEPRRLASVLLSLDDSSLSKAERGGELIEVPMSSKFLADVHETARGPFDLGVIDKATMREFDLLSLPPARPRTPDEIRSIRAANHVSQTVFAAFLGVGKSTVQQWEQGLKRPSATALRLLEVVERRGLATLVPES